MSPSMLNLSGSRRTSPRQHGKDSSPTRSCCSHGAVAEHLTRSAATLSLTLLAESVLVMDPTGRREQPRSGPPASTILRQSGAADPWLVEPSRRANVRAREEAVPTRHKAGLRRSVAGSVYGTIKAAVSSGHVLRRPLLLGLPRSRVVARTDACAGGVRTRRYAGSSPKVHG